MKKSLFTILLFATSIVGFSQTEISGYADLDPSNGINDGTAATYRLDQAIAYCRDLVENGDNDWYLPSVEELLLFMPDQTLCAASTPGCVSDPSECVFVAARYHKTRSMMSSAGFVNLYTYCNASSFTTTTASATPYYVRCVR